MDRAPSGWVRCRCGFESSPFKSSARRPSVEVYVPASRIDRKNAKVNAIKFSHGELQYCEASVPVVLVLVCTNPNPKVRKSGAVGKAVLVSMVLAGSIRVARGDSGEGMVNLRQRHSILTW